MKAQTWLFPDRSCVVRGGGDLATGVIWRLVKCGFPVIATELASPLTVRRTVAASTAVTEGHILIEGMTVRKATDTADALAISAAGEVPILVNPGLPEVPCFAVVDARMAKRNLGTARTDAHVVIGLGPGFEARGDCDYVVETNRGPHLGRVLSKGTAEPNTGSPGVVAGHGAERVLRAVSSGVVRWRAKIGDTVAAGQELGEVGTQKVTAPFDGVVRGLVLDGLGVQPGTKIGDIDPRMTVNCHEISDKALSVAGGVLEAVLSEMGALDSAGTREERR